jgi:hypothetical protein
VVFKTLAGNRDFESNPKFGTLPGNTVETNSAALCIRKKLHFNFSRGNMTYLHQLERDLSAATSDGELFARSTIATSLAYISQGLSLTSLEIRALLDDIMSEYPERPKLQIVAGRALNATQGNR